MSRRRNEHGNPRKHLESESVCPTGQSLTGSPGRLNHQCLGEGRGTARSGMTRRGIREDSVFEEWPDPVRRHAYRRQVEMSSEQRDTATEGKRTRGIGSIARAPMLACWCRAWHVAVADHQLPVAMNRTRHEAAGNQCMRDERNENERRQALTDRSTKNLGPTSAHTAELCVAQARPGKRGEHGRSNTDGK
jgi:hypothetical protein